MLKRSLAYQIKLSITLCLFLFFSAEVAVASSVQINLYDSDIDISVDGQNFGSGDLIFLNSSDIFIFNSIFDGLKLIESKHNLKKNSSQDVAPISFIETDTVNNWNLQALNPVAGDFIGDEEDDLLAFQGFTGDLSIIWGFEGSDSNLKKAESIWSSGYGKWDSEETQLAKGDFNSDGLLDLVGFYSYGTQAATAWFFENNADGFDDPLEWWVSSGTWNGKATQIISGDFDGDQQTDLLGLEGTGNNRSTIWFFKNNGAGFENPVPWWRSPGEWRGDNTVILSDDFDLDGHQDMIAFYNYNFSRTKAWFFKGYGRGFYYPQVWWDSIDSGWNAKAMKVATGDFNADGLIDFFAFYANENKSSSAFIFVNHGNKLGEPIKLWDSGIGRWDGENTKIVSGDFDGDGIPSSVVAISDFSGQGLGIFLLGPIDDQTESDLWRRQF